MNSEEALAFINIGLAISGFPIIYFAAILYAWIRHAIAWICDTSVDMDHTKVATAIRKLNPLATSNYNDYYFQAAGLGGFTSFITIALVISYWVPLMRYVIGLVGCVFIGMYALRWMVRTGKSLAKLRKIAHEHIAAEKSEDHEMLKAA